MNKNEEEEQKWLDWAIELQSLAQAGLAYGDFGRNDCTQN